MRIVVTGASGLVGSTFVRFAAAAGHEIIGIVGRYDGALPGLNEQVSVDLSDPDTLQRRLDDWRPRAIVNCAAISEPAACDADPAGSERLNVDLPAALARAARRLDARLVHVSTEQVFAGDRAPYRTSDPVRPINRYGRQKAASEAAVTAAAPQHVATVRAPLLMGNSATGQRSLHERLLSDWMNGRTARLFTDEIRQVAHADNLCGVLLELCERPDLTGIFHWAGSDPLSRHDLGVGIRTHFRLTPEHAPITATNRTENAAAAATRPADLRLDLAPLIQELRTQPQTFAEQLQHLAIPPACQRWLANLSR